MYDLDDIALVILIGDSEPVIDAIERCRQAADVLSQLDLLLTEDALIGQSGQNLDGSILDAERVPIRPAIFAKV